MLLAMLAAISPFFRRFFFHLLIFFAIFRDDFRHAADAAMPAFAMAPGGRAHMMLRDDEAFTHTMRPYHTARVFAFHDITLFSTLTISPMFFRRCRFSPPWLNKRPA